MNEHQRKLLTTIFFKHGTQPIRYGTLTNIRVEVVGGLWTKVDCDIHTLVCENYLERGEGAGWRVSNVALAELKELADE